MVSLPGPLLPNVLRTRAIPPPVGVVFIGGLAGAPPSLKKIPHKTPGSRVG